MTPPSATVWVHHPSGRVQREIARELAYGEFALQHHTPNLRRIAVRRTDGWHVWLEPVR